MGHIRLGELPRTRKWEQVVELITCDGDAATIAAAALDAAEKGFQKGAEDIGLGRATWLLTQLPLAARDPNYLDRLKALGVAVEGGPVSWSLSAPSPTPSTRRCAELVAAAISARWRKWRPRKR